MKPVKPVKPVKLVRFTLLFLLALSGSVEAQSLGRTYLVVVRGLGGESGYRDQFHEQAVSMIDTSQGRLGLPAENIWYLGEDPERDTERIRGKSTKEGIEKALAEVGQRVEPGDQVVVILIGHGSYDSGESRFNLPGPDVSAREFALMLDRFGSQQVVFVNTTSASGGFIEALSGKNRIVVTATKSGMERNEAQFGKFFIEAFAGEGADVDKDKRISVWEAFEYARLKVAHAYEESNQLQTEHALLDDNGDQQGAHRPDEPAGGEGSSLDGSVARLAFLQGSVTGGGRADASRPTPDDPELAALYGDKRVLEQRIEALKQQKEGMSDELYMQELESLLVELARKNQAIDAMEEKSH